MSIEETFDSVPSRGGFATLKFISQAGSFALLLCKCNASPRIELLRASETRSLDHQIWRRLHFASVSKHNLRARAVCLLGSGDYVLASLKKGINNGDIVSAVDFSIEPPSERLFEFYLSSLEDSEQ
jgi:hypothetical protein